MINALIGARLSVAKVGVAMVACLLTIAPSASADPTPTGPAVQPLETISGPVAEELRQIQRSLGGSAVEQFPSLKDPESRPASAPVVASPLAGPHQRGVIEALRMAATQLDDIANRLERMELYQRADALREQAQRLRLDARGMVGNVTTTPTPGPLWGEGIRPSGGDPRLAPQPQMPEPRALEPQPLQPGPSSIEPQPLEPVPQTPQSQRDPAPQPLEPTPSPE
jgi:hypothetical protein